MTTAANPDMALQPDTLNVVPAPHETEQQRRNWVVAGIILFMFVLLAIYLTWDAQFPPQLGFNDKTVWDVLYLLVVPLALAGVAAYLNKVQKDSEDRTAKSRQAEEENLAKHRRAEAHTLAEQRRKDNEVLGRARDNQIALQSFLDRITELLIDPNGEAIVRGMPKITLIRARTLAILPSLDGERRGLLLRFLYEAELIYRDRHILEPTGADFREADLFRATLPEIYLRGATLEGAKLIETVLTRADLQSVMLRAARLDGAWLNNADLSFTQLPAAFLIGTHLNDAVLRGANLEAAHLEGADLRGAELQDAVLDQVSYDSRTKWPHGFQPPVTAVRGT